MNITPIHECIPPEKLKVIVYCNWSEMNKLSINSYQNIL